MRAPLLVAILLATAAPASAQLLRIDASQPTPPVREGTLKLGTGTGPQGTIAINNRYLTRDGRPWIPIMGEFHYSRYPAAEWEGELLKMKASGIDTVASYVIWNQHELAPGKLDWTGDRDVRRFAELCAKHGLTLLLRPGPWVHGETRFGGLPDWVVEHTGRRSNDPAYMAEVERFWTALAGQMRGLMWKDGGPVIGVQMENEYNLTGPGKGAEHIAALKALAIRLGMDAPLYTVTGWDNAVYPRGEVAPVVGGYIDEPWATLIDKMPARENYLFRFDSRVAGGLGAQTAGDASRVPDADRDRDLTPFLGAEYGPGVPVMYRRRPIVSPDDVASSITTQIGSGLNLLGYYMYHDGSNPTANGRGLEETVRSGGYNDVPRIAYAYGAAIGQYGQINPVQNRLRPLHYFLTSHGERLARMTLRRPDRVPSARDDFTTPRVAVRSDGESGFVFVNNHLRQYPMATHPDMRFDVALPGGSLQFPSRPMRVADGSYFLFPFNLKLGTATLRWASAQPITEVAGVHVFKAIDGIAPEFAFDAAEVAGANAPVRRVGDRLLVDARPSATSVVEVRLRSGGSVRLLLLAQADADRLWVGDLLGERRLVLTDAGVSTDDGALTLRQRGNAQFRFAAWPAIDGVQGARRMDNGSGPVRYEAAAPVRRLPAIRVTQVRKPREAPPVEMIGPNGSAAQPKPEAFAQSGAWRFTVPADSLRGVADSWLTIDYRGDIGRLFEGHDMLDDSFWDGRRWNVALRRFAGRLGKPWEISILPLRKDAPIYLDEKVRPTASDPAQIAQLRGIMIEPEYAVTITRK